ncbi:MAG: 50S ribosomal protein L4 [bacterium]|nr:50S ribosomal protein L4 [bacterium]
MNIKLHNQEGKEVGKMDLPDTVFGLKWNEALVYQVATSLQSNQRRVTAKVKNRGEVRGGGKKPWKQKGTGRARHGSIRSPIWKGGGATHGPTGSENFKKSIPRKMAKKALYTVLSAKVKDKEIFVLDDLKISEPKTKHAVGMLKHFPEFKNKNTLFALPKLSDTIKRSFRNIPKVGYDEVRNLNALEVLQYQYIVFTKEGIEQLK